MISCKENNCFNTPFFSWCVFRFSSRTNRSEIFADDSTRYISHRNNFCSRNDFYLHLFCDYWKEKCGYGEREKQLFLVFLSRNIRYFLKHLSVLSRKNSIYFCWSNELEYDKCDFSGYVKEKQKNRRILGIDSLPKVLQRLLELLLQGCLRTILE